MSTQDTIQFYSFYYKPVNVDFLKEHYVPMWVGKNNKSPIDGFLGDDSGIHISDKNKNYSELTGLYWVWKNTETKIIGSCHYRRFFTLKEEPLPYRLKRSLYFPLSLWKKRFGLIYSSNCNYWAKHLLSTNDAQHILNEYDIILPKRRILRQTIKQHYSKHHNAADLVVLENILKENSPEFLLTYQTVLDQNRLFANNMFVLERDKFDELMEWLFGILFLFEQTIPVENYTGYQERIFGFLAERLITVWVEHKKLKYKELSLVYFKKLKKQ